MASALSRTNSASSRRGFCEASRRLSGSTLAQLGPQPGDLPIGVARHDQLHHVLHVPAALAELDGEPVEQFRMRRPLALRAEVVDLRAEAGAEELLPEAVHERRARSAGSLPRRATSRGRAG